MLYYEVDYSIFSRVNLDDIPEPTVEERERFKAGLDTLRLQPTRRYLQGK